MDEKSVKPALQSFTMTSQTQPCYHLNKEQSRALKDKTQDWRVCMRITHHIVHTKTDHTTISALALPFLVHHQHCCRSVGLSFQQFCLLVEDK
jgi:hypothetical protein